MRPTTLVFLATICILIASVRGGFSSGPARKSNSKSSVVKVSSRESAPPPVKISFWTKPFYGRTTDNARQLAVEDAQRELRVQLAKLIPSLTWNPTGPYVEERVKETKLSDEKVEVDGNRMQGVSLLVELSGDDYDKILRIDQDARRDHNQLFLARIVATIVAVCSAIAVYFRLDEATKGYYTTLLRLGSLAVVGLVGAGVWLLMR